MSKIQAIWSRNLKYSKFLMSATMLTAPAITLFLLGVVRTTYLSLRHSNRFSEKSFANSGKLIIPVGKGSHCKQSNYVVGRLSVLLKRYYRHFYNTKPVFSKFKFKNKFEVIGPHIGQMRHE